MAHRGALPKIHHDIPQGSTDKGHNTPRGNNTPRGRIGNNLNKSSKASFTREISRWTMNQSEFAYLKSVKLRYLEKVFTHLTHEERDLVDNLFYLANQSWSGYVSGLELQVVLEDILDTKVKTSMANSLLTALDYDGNGKVDILDFFHMFYSVECYLRCVSGASKSQSLKSDMSPVDALLFSVMSVYAKKNGVHLPYDTNLFHTKCLSTAHMRKEQKVRGHGVDKHKHLASERRMSLREQRESVVNPNTMYCFSLIGCLDGKLKECADLIDHLNSWAKSPYSQTLPALEEKHGGQKTKKTNRKKGAEASPARVEGPRAASPRRVSTPSPTVQSWLASDSKMSRPQKVAPTDTLQKNSTHADPEGIELAPPEAASLETSSPRKAPADGSRSSVQALPPITSATLSDHQQSPYAIGQSSKPLPELNSYHGPALFTPVGRPKDSYRKANLARINLHYDIPKKLSSKQPTSQGLHTAPKEGFALVQTTKEFGCDQHVLSYSSQNIPNSKTTDCWQLHSQSEIKSKLKELGSLQSSEATKTDRSQNAAHGLDSRGGGRNPFYALQPLSTGGNTNKPYHDSENSLGEPRDACSSPYTAQQTYGYTEQKPASDGAVTPSISHKESGELPYSEDLGLHAAASGHVPYSEPISYNENGYHASLLSQTEDVSLSADFGEAAAGLPYTDTLDGLHAGQPYSEEGNYFVEDASKAPYSNEADSCEVTSNTPLNTDRGTDMPSQAEYRMRVFHYSETAYVLEKTRTPRADSFVPATSAAANQVPYSVSCSEEDYSRVPYSSEGKTVDEASRVPYSDEGIIPNDNSCAPYSNEGITLNDASQAPYSSEGETLNEDSHAPYESESATLELKGNAEAPYESESATLDETLHGPYENECASSVGGSHAPFESASGTLDDSLYGTHENESATSVEGLHAPYENESGSLNESLYGPHDSETATPVDGSHAPYESESATIEDNSYAPNESNEVTIDAGSCAPRDSESVSLGETSFHSPYESESMTQDHGSHTPYESDRITMVDGSAPYESESAQLDNNLHTQQKSEGASLNDAADQSPEEYVTPFSGVREHELTATFSGTSSEAGLRMFEADSSPENTGETILRAKYSNTPSASGLNPFEYDVGPGESKEPALTAKFSGTPSEAGTKMFEADTSPEKAGETILMAKYSNTPSLSGINSFEADIGPKESTEPALTAKFSGTPSEAGTTIFEADSTPEKAGETMLQTKYSNTPSKSGLISFEADVKLIELQEPALVTKFSGTPSKVGMKMFEADSSPEQTGETMLQGKYSNTPSESGIQVFKADVGPEEFREPALTAKFSGTPSEAGTKMFEADTSPEKAGETILKAKYSNTPSLSGINSFEADIGPEESREPTLTAKFSGTPSKVGMKMFEADLSPEKAGETMLQTKYSNTPSKSGLTSFEADVGPTELEEPSLMTKFSGTPSKVGMKMFEADLSSKEARETILGVKYSNTPSESGLNPFETDVRPEEFRESALTAKFSGTPSEAGTKMFEADSSPEKTGETMLLTKYSNTPSKSGLTSFEADVGPEESKEPALIAKFSGTPSKVDMKMFEADTSPQKAGETTLLVKYSNTPSISGIRTFEADIRPEEFREPALTVKFSGTPSETGLTMFEADSSPEKAGETMLFTKYSNTPSKSGFTKFEADVGPEESKEPTLTAKFSGTPSKVGMEIFEADSSPKKAGGIMLQAKYSNTPSESGLTSFEADVRPTELQEPSLMTKFSGTPSKVGMKMFEADLSPEKARETVLLAKSSNTPSKSGLTKFEADVGPEESKEPALIAKFSGTPSEAGTTMFEADSSPEKAGETMLLTKYSNTPSKSGLTSFEADIGPEDSREPTLMGKFSGTPSEAGIKMFEADSLPVKTNRRNMDSRINAGLNAPGVYSGYGTPQEMNASLSDLSDTLVRESPGSQHVSSRHLDSPQGYSSSAGWGISEERSPTPLTTSSLMVQGSPGSQHADSRQSAHPYASDISSEAHSHSSANESLSSSCSMVESRLSPGSQHVDSHIDVSQMDTLSSQTITVPTTTANSGSSPSPGSSVRAPASPGSQHLSSRGRQRSKPPSDRTPHSFSSSTQSDSAILSGDSSDSRHCPSRKAPFSHSASTPLSNVFVNDQSGSADHPWSSLSRGHASDTTIREQSGALDSEISESSRIEASTGKKVPPSKTDSLKVKATPRRSPRPTSAQRSKGRVSANGNKTPVQVPQFGKNIEESRGDGNSGPSTYDTSTHTEVSSFSNVEEDIAALKKNIKAMKRPTELFDLPMPPTKKLALGQTTNLVAARAIATDDNAFMTDAQNLHDKVSAEGFKDTANVWAKKQLDRLAMEGCLVAQLLNPSYKGKKTVKVEDLVGPVRTGGKPNMTPILTNSSAKFKEFQLSREPYKPPSPSKQHGWNMHKSSMVFGTSLASQMLPSMDSSYKDHALGKKINYGARVDYGDINIIKMRESIQKAFHQRIRKTSVEMAKHHWKETHPEELETEESYNRFLEAHHAYLPRSEKLVVIQSGQPGSGTGQGY